MQHKILRSRHAREFSAMHDDGKLRSNADLAAKGQRPSFRKVRGGVATRSPVRDGVIEQESIMHPGASAGTASGAESKRSEAAGEAASSSTSRSG